MSQKRVTKDELFLVKLYQEGEKLGDPFMPLDRYQIGKLVSQNDKGVDNMVRMLAQANFIKKDSGNSIYITKQGEALIQDFL